MPLAQLIKIYLISILEILFHEFYMFMRKGFKIEDYYHKNYVCLVVILGQILGPLNPCNANEVGIIAKDCSLM